MITKKEAFDTATESLKKDFPLSYKKTEKWLETLWSTIIDKARDKEYRFQTYIPEECMPFAYYIKDQIREAGLYVWREEDYLLIDWS